MKMNCSKCSKCGQINPTRALDGGLCWKCAGYRRPPTLLRERHVREELDDPTHSDRNEQEKTHDESNT